MPEGGSLPVVPRVVGPGRLRKVALIGSADSIRDAPWSDPSWEIWAHTSSWKFCQRVDRWFELHDETRVNERKAWHPDYHSWLKTVTVPVYMQRKVKGIRASVTYPKARALAEFPHYFTSQAAWMVALALMEGVTHLGFFGIHYGYLTEYAAQRAGCEFWMGVAVGRGVQLVVPERSPLLKEPPALYGYEDAKFHGWLKDWKHGVASLTKPFNSAELTVCDPTDAPIPTNLSPAMQAHLERARRDPFWMLKTPTSLPQRKVEDAAQPIG